MADDGKDDLKEDRTESIATVYILHVPQAAILILVTSPNARPSS
jgi:hypothetical protein